MNKKLTVLLAVALVAGLVAFGVQNAQAVTPNCGDTLTSSVQFDSDLDCRTLAEDGVALTVGASNITINLGGYEIIGPATATTCPATGSDSDGTRGILVEDYDNVNILNGVITGFERGIRVEDATGVKITNIEAYDNAFSAVRVYANADVTVNQCYFHNNLNDQMGVSDGSHVTVMNSELVDGCASGIFVNVGASADLINNYITGNYRSAINFWGASGSAVNNFIQGNNLNPIGSGSDFGQISLVNLDGSEILIRCNVIRDSDDVQDNVERAIGFRGSSTASEVEITKNLIVNNPVAIWFGGNGNFVGVGIHKNTFEINTTDFDLPGSNWTVDADKNFYAAGAPVITNTGGNTLTTDPILKSAQHCRGAAGAPLKGSIGGDSSGFSGNLTHLGTFDGVYDPVEETAVYTAANGDTVTTHTIGFVAVDCLNPPDCFIVTYVQKLEITGGTGRFFNATGSATVEGVFNFSTLEFDGYLKGTISRPNSGR